MNLRLDFFHGHLLGIEGRFPKKHTEDQPADLDPMLGINRGPLCPAPHFISGEGGSISFWNSGPPYIKMA